jgi:DNA-binding CsgD family transcriptional regulator
MASVVLMATLGSKAQLITLTLDCLSKQGIWPEEVVVFHTWRERSETAHALLRLSEDSKLNTSFPPFRFVELKNADGALRDVTLPEELEVAFRSLYSEIRASKMAEKSVHLLIAGGRRTLTVFGMAVAQMLFDDTDFLWHLASHPELEASGRLHAGPEEWVRLIPIPVIPWGRLSPVFNTLFSIEDPLAAVEQLNQIRLREQWDLARIFMLTKVSSAEQVVVKLLVCDGLNQMGISSRLSLSPRTVEQHLRSVYRKAADHWGLEHVNQTMLVRLLNLYCTTSST